MLVKLEVKLLVYLSRKELNSSETILEVNRQKEKNGREEPRIKSKESTDATPRDATSPMAHKALFTNT